MCFTTGERGQVLHYAEVTLMKDTVEDQCCPAVLGTLRKAVLAENVCMCGDCLCTTCADPPMSILIGSCLYGSMAYILHYHSPLGHLTILLKAALDNHYGD